MKKNTLEAMRLKNLGLTRDQLRAVAGGRPPPETSQATVRGVTKCCW